MRSDIQSYHLGGMGCSNGVVAINLVRDMLIVGDKNWTPLIITTRLCCQILFRDGLIVYYCCLLLVIVFYCW